MIGITWIHLKWWIRDLRARKLGDLTYVRNQTTDVVSNQRREWRIG